MYFVILEFLVIRFSRHILISLSLLCTLPAIAEEAIVIRSQTVLNTQDAIKDLQGLLGDIKSFSADFVQETRTGGDVVLQSINGHMNVAKPGKLRWKTEGVYEQLVVSDGKSIWIFDEDLEQVSIKNMNNRLSETPALLLGGDVSVIENDFIVSQKHTESQFVFILLPKDTSQLFDSLELRFNKLSQQKVLQEMIISDASGQFTDIRFTNSANNPKLNADLFTFEIPKGIDVIDGRQGSY
ncbi:MAG: outer membrane lipoprotein carrier protein LolA [Oleispira sp.]|nr:outer membrane lipoprotein carrier protein LolA [Oleispira sp.]